MPANTFPEIFHASGADFLTWTVLDGDARQNAIRDLAGIVSKKELRGEIMAVREAGLAFYDDLSLLAYEVEGEGRDMFFLARNGQPLGDFRLLGKNVPIHNANERFGVKLTAENVSAYCRFFFHFVHGKHGTFHITERPEQIRWRDEAGAEIREEAEGLLIPLVSHGLAPDGFFHCTTTVIFRNALFKTSILVASRDLTSVMFDDDILPDDYSVGQCRLVDEEMLLEELAVHIV